ncbi:hypothetical protein [Methylobacter sp.]|uniref:hypothetical protein n=1 Tax=Methylobacter sp. TaxID=2051955 RepID=UPI003DA460C1
MNAEKNQATENQQTLTDEELVKIASFEPAITAEQLNEMERISSGNSCGMQRRLAFLACARSADELSKLNIEEPEAFKEMLDSIEAFKDHAQGLAEIAESAYFRMLLVGARQETTIQ